MSLSCISESFAGCGILGVPSFKIRAVSLHSPPAYTGWWEVTWRSDWPSSEGNPSSLLHTVFVFHCGRFYYNTSRCSPLLITPFRIPAISFFILIRDAFHHYVTNRPSSSFSPLLQELLRHACWAVCWNHSSWAPRWFFPFLLDFLSEWDFLKTCLLAQRFFLLPLQVCKTVELYFIYWVL